MSHKIIYGTIKGSNKYIRENGYLYAIVKPLKWAPWLFRAALYSKDELTTYDSLDAEAQIAVDKLKSELHIPEQTK